MRKCVLVGAALAVVGGPAPGQVSPTVIGQSIMPLNQKPLGKCYDPNLPQKPELVQDRQSRAEVAIRGYLALAAAGSDVSGAFADKKHGWWVLDGDRQQVRSARDPWAARTHHLELVGFAVSNISPYEFHGAWRAIAADGSTLGYYDAFMQRGAKGSAWMTVLRLVSATGEPPKVSRYCRVSNDIEDPKRRF